MEEYQPDPDVEVPQRAPSARRWTAPCSARPSSLEAIKPVVTSWKKPITIARHAYGDVYKAVEYRVPGAGKAELVFTDESGAETDPPDRVQTSTAPACVQGHAQHGTTPSCSFARCCFYLRAVDVRQDVWFSTKDTISKDYDQTFKLLFQEVYDEELQGQV